MARERLTDDTLLVFVSDVHIGGAGGSDIFESADELRGLIAELDGHAGPVELVLAGDFIDVLRLAGADTGTGVGDEVAETLAPPEYHAMEHAGQFWFKDVHSRVAQHRHGRAERARSDRAIRETLDGDHRLPLADNVSGREIAVFVTGHTHAPSLSPTTRQDGTDLVIVNTGCWLRQLQPVTP